MNLIELIAHSTTDKTVYSLMMPGLHESITEFVFKRCHQSKLFSFFLSKSLKGFCKINLSQHGIGNVSVINLHLHFWLALDHILRTLWSRRIVLILLECDYPLCLDLSVCV